MPTHTTENETQRQIRLRRKEQINKCIRIIRRTQSQTEHQIEREFDRLLYKTHASRSEIFRLKLLVGALKQIHDAHLEQSWLYEIYDSPGR